MRPSAFNVRVPLASGEVFLMNTLTDAQAVVSDDVVALLDKLDSGSALDPAVVKGEKESLATLEENGFLVRHRSSERAALESHFAEFREDASQLRITILTTLQCNFACDYCYQGEHGESGRPAERMSIDTAAQVAAWIAKQVEEVKPRRLVLTFFGGEPLLNVPAMFEIAGRSSKHAASRGVMQSVSIITNGLLLTPQIVECMVPLGLTGVKVTLDGDRDTHDRMRPLRGGQGTFDRIIENIRRVAPLVPVTIGGNFDMETAGRYPALLDFLKAQDFAGRIVKVAFKPVIKPAAQVRTGGVIPLRAVDLNGLAAERKLHVRRRGLDGPRALCGDRLPVRQLQPRRRRDLAAARGDAAAWVPDARRRAHGPVRGLPPPLPHHRSGRRALRVPRLHRRVRTRGGTHRRPARARPRGGGAAVRSPRAVAPLRRLSVHPGLRRGLRGGRPRRAWRHGCALMSQAEH